MRRESLARAPGGSGVIRRGRGEIRYSTRASMRRDDWKRKAEGRMGGIKVLTTLYAIFFVLMILIVIGSFFGVFENRLIDPGL